MGGGIETFRKEVADDLLRRARNLERYPFVSATMAEAAVLAAVELRKVAASLEQAKAA
jgi:hypothetical protein